MASTILIVDDSRFLRKQLSKFLAEHGYEVLAEGENGNEGFKLYEEHRPDIVLLDITMPLRCGYDCLCDILEAYPEAKVLMCSAISDMAIIEKCLEKGAINFIPKPLKLSDQDYCESFIERLQEALMR